MSGFRVLCQLGTKHPFCIILHHKKCATGWFNLISLTIWIKALTPMASQRLHFLPVGHGAESHCAAVKPVTMWITHMAPNQRIVTALTEKRTDIRLKKSRTPTWCQSGNIILALEHSRDKMWIAATAMKRGAAMLSAREQWECLDCILALDTISCRLWSRVEWLSGTFSWVKSHE